MRKQEGLDGVGDQSLRQEGFFPIPRHGIHNVEAFLLAGVGSACAWPRRPWRRAAAAYLLNHKMTDPKGLCSICLQDLGDGWEQGRLPCGHVFHAACAIRWFRTHRSRGLCPVCREPPPAEDDHTPTPSREDSEADDDEDLSELVRLALFEEMNMSSPESLHRHLAPWIYDRTRPSAPALRRGMDSYMASRRRHRAALASGSPGAAARSAQQLKRTSRWLFAQIYL